MSGYKIGYARVSRETQNAEQQITALRSSGCDEIFTETASGAKKDRPELAKLLSRARRGDVVTVWKLDRLARSLRQLIDIADDFKKRGIHLHSLTDNIDTSTASGELHFHMLAALAQFERGTISERVKAGLDVAKSQGRTGGRPRADEAKVMQALAMVGGGMSVTQAAKAAGISRATLYRARPVSKTYKRGNGHTSNFETGFETEIPH